MFELSRQSRLSRTRKSADEMEGGDGLSSYNLIVGGGSAEEGEIHGRKIKSRIAGFVQA